MDAPIHFAKDPLTVDNVPLESLSGAPLRIAASVMELEDFK